MQTRTTYKVRVPGSAVLGVETIVQACADDQTQVTVSNSATIILTTQFILDLQAINQPTCSRSRPARAALAVILMRRKQPSRTIGIDAAIRELQLSTLCIGATVHWTDPYANDPDPQDIKRSNRRFTLNSLGAHVASGLLKITDIRSDTKTIEGPETEIFLIDPRGSEVIALGSELRYETGMPMMSDARLTQGASAPWLGAEKIDRL